MQLPANQPELQPEIYFSHIHCDITIRAAMTGDVVGTLIDEDGNRIPLDDLRVSDQVRNGDVTIIPVPGTHVTIAASSGNVRIFGYVGTVTLMSVAGDVQVNGLDGELRVANVSGDVSLRSIFAVHGMNMRGNVGVQDIRDNLTLNHVDGDVTLTHIGTCVVQQIGGDLTATDIYHSCVIDRIEGDARLLDILGNVQIAAIMGDLQAENLRGGITTTVGGDAFVETTLGSNRAYTITANDIVLRVRSPINAQFVAASRGGAIRTHLPLTVERHRQHLVGIIGDGSATVTLNSQHGSILLDAAQSDFTANRVNEPSRGITVHIKDGADSHTFDIHGPFLERLGLGGNTFTWPPIIGGVPMNNNNPNPNQTPSAQELEQRLRDLGERGGRAARKAGEKVKEYTDKAQSRARDTDWESVSREVRSAVERTVSELEVAFREIVAEFQTPGPHTPTNGAPPTNTPTAGPRPATPPAAQRVPIDLDPTGTAGGVEDVAARRRAILEQVKAGDITLEQAEAQLRNI